MATQVQSPNATPNKQTPAKAPSQGGNERYEADQRGAQQPVEAQNLKDKKPGQSPKHEALSGTPSSVNTGADGTKSPRTP